MRKYLFTFLIGATGGGIFSLIHAPIPWLLGSLLSICVLRLGFKRDILWSKQIRDFAMIALGYMIGRSFTPEAGHNILSLLPILALVTLVNIIVCLLASLVIWRFTETNLATSLFGSMPAGLSQVAAICEKEKDVDIGIITLMQSIRLITVIVVVPFIALHGLSDIDRTSLPFTGSQLGCHELKMLGIYFLVIIFFIFWGKRFQLSNIYIIFPIVVTAVLALTGLDAPPIPSVITITAQICVGIHIGNQINMTTLRNWKRISFFSLLNIFGIIGMFLGVDYLITKISPMSFLTAFISTAPGGMAEMGITAMMVQADVSTVATFQLFRLLFVILVTTPALSRGLKYSKRHRIKGYNENTPN